MKGFFQGGGDSIFWVTRVAGCDNCYGFKQNVMAELKRGTGRCPNCDGPSHGWVGGGFFCVLQRLVMQKMCMYEIV